MKTLIFWAIWFIPGFLSAQIHGRITEKKSQEPIPGVTVRWKGFEKIAVISDLDGHFEISQPKGASWLVFSAVGYLADSLEVLKGNSHIQVSLLPASTELAGVVVRGSGTVIDRLSPMQTQVITAKELGKAACCNLSESFETNGAVSVSYTDAVTGAKQIQLLGLGGAYVQTTLENLPGIRGLASSFGLNYIPGTWIQSIDVAKGTGGVPTGYESMTGGINVELKKPDESEPLFVNGYVNHWGRGELNVQLAHKFSKKWSMGVLSHGSFLASEIDRNPDGFRDLARYDQINVLNRWKYASERWMAQFGGRYLQENRLGGQIGFKSEALTPALYGFTNQTKRGEGFFKLARLFPAKPFQGFALLGNAVWHDTRSLIGRRVYSGQQRSAYFNSIYQNILGDTRHTYKIGASIQLDEYAESFGNLVLNRTEIVPGVYGEYTYTDPENITLVVGQRLDYHNLFGWQYTPRVHVKKHFKNHTDWRLHVGRGFRVGNPLAENMGLLVSSRQVVLRNPIQPEISWNMGTSLGRDFGKMTVMADVYHTRFQQQQIVDAEHPGHLYLYMSNGPSYATAAQIEAILPYKERWEFKAAYRFFDVKQTMQDRQGNEVFLEKMMVNKHRVLTNIAYALPYNKWKADLTIHWNGSMRLPMIGEAEAGRSPSFFNVNAQVTRTFRTWEWYLGGENLTNFRQLNPIVQAREPFGSQFDAGIVWGPIVGRTIYSGFRWKLGS